MNVYQSPVLQGMINGLIEIGRCCGMEMNVGEKTEVMSISSLSSQVQIMVDNKKKTWRLWIISTECVAWWTMEDVHAKINPGFPW